MHTPLRALAVIGAALVLMVGGAVAYAAIPSANGTIRACYDNGGNLKLIDEGAGCPKGYKGPISWNQQGVPGEDGVSGREVVTNHTRGFFVGITAQCPPGKKVIGGGGDVALLVEGGGGVGAAIRRSIPAIDSLTGDEGWQVVAIKTDGTALDVDEQFDITAYAVCVTAG